MKTKLGAALIAGLMMFGLFGVVNASADPDPEGPAKKGLCTAYFNGQKNGHDKNGDPGPFQALEDAAANSDGVDNDGDGDTDDGQESIDDGTAEGDLEQAEAVFSFCDGLIGGNPDHGRYDCTADDPTTEEDETACQRNPAPNEKP